MKHITVFGANGKVGRVVVEGLLDRGYEVTAVMRSVKGVKPTKHLRLVEGDIHNADTLKDALTGAHAVISTLGSWGTKEKDILSAGMHAIIPLMKRHRVRRIISLTGSEARASGDVFTVTHRLAHTAARLLAGKILVDGEEHIRQLEQSNLQWTVIRSPIMNEKDTPEYQLGGTRPQPWDTIHRLAVADALVHQLVDDKFVGKAPFITR